MPDTAGFPQMDSHGFPLGQTAEGETVLSNGVSGEVAISICVPCFHDSADALIATLSRMDLAARATLLLFDDGSGNPALTRLLARHMMHFPGPARLITSPDNLGRAGARNRLLALAETDWVLFLDADMRPDDDQFLVRYLDALRAADGPALIAGGFSLKHVKPTKETELHAAQALKSECLPADTRAKQPGHHVFTSNILVHADILKAVGFDAGFTGWGWEDVDWGLRVAADYPVLHIDNPATHLGLDATPALIDKFGGSAANFAYLAERHPDAVKQMPLWRMARGFRHLPARPLWRGLTKAMAKTGALPLGLRLNALKTYRALCYAEALK
ncbi:MAG: glycosyltransferase family A protein [Henriciella sp.]|uniref:glycosyltransferase family 2 protein n=1 Tax=Henriciella sp. TaxID=1968823 RepID=UPI003C745FAA